MLTHDQNFKNLIADYMLPALKFMLPAQTEHWPADIPNSSECTPN